MALNIILLIAFSIGVIAGAFGMRSGIAYAVLFALIAASVAAVSWWQSENLDVLRSTSALEYVFGPLLPVGGFLLGKIYRLSREPR